MRWPRCPSVDGVQKPVDGGGAILATKVSTSPPPTGPGVSRVRGWAKPVPTGALHQLCDDDGVNLHQLTVQQVHSIGGG
jgi:hypothetical protein